MMNNLKNGSQLRYFWVMSAMVCSLLTGQAGAADLTIVEHGQARAVIVVAANEPKAAKAAQELQKYIEQMSGASLPIIEEGQPVNQPVTILVGHTEAAAKLKVMIPAGYDPNIRSDAFEEEGYVLKTVGNVIVVGGNSDAMYQGTIYAAYALLEKLGCRFYFPGEWGEVVPKQATIQVPDLDETVRPDFSQRSIWLSGWVRTTREESDIYYNDWSLKVGFNINRGKDMYPAAGDGFLAGLLPPSEFAETHPEYYAMNELGVRAITPKKHASFTMLCLSNPDVLSASIANLKEVFAGQRKMRIANDNGFGISPPDGTPYCYCPDCKALSQNFKYPQYVHRTMQSEEFFSFAAKLAQAFPDKWVGTTAYSLREIPPQGVTLPPNVAVTLAPISACVLHSNNDPHCWRRLDFIKILTEWRQLTPHVMIYDYNPGLLLGNWVPERDVANFAINAPIYKQVGIKGVNAEGRKAFMQSWISYYIRGKLLWNANADVTAIKKDFYTTFFGPDAGPQVQAWWDACEARLATSTAHVHEDWLVNHLYTVDFVESIRNHVEMARSANLTDAQRDRVEAFTLIADHLLAFAQMNDATSRLDYTAAAAACERMTDCKEKLHDIYSFFISVDRKVKRPYFAEGLKAGFEALAAKTNGQTGTLVAPLPLEMKFTRDRFNQGVIGKWYSTGFDDSSWGKKNTFYTWDQQDKPEDTEGHDYDGYGWYRATIDIPASAAGQTVSFYSSGMINEGWVWINGQYAGHKSHKIWWKGPHSQEFDVTKLIKPGQPNTITIRIWNDSEIGGMYGRGFFWAAKP